MVQRYKIIFKQQKIQKNNYLCNLSLNFFLLPILSPSYKSHNRSCGSHSIAPIIARAFPIQNSKFIIPFALLWRKLAACAQFIIHNSLPVLFVPLVAPVSQFIICQFPSHYLECFIGLKNSFLYGV